MKPQKLSLVPQCLTRCTGHWPQFQTNICKNVPGPFPWPSPKLPWPFSAFCKMFYLEHDMIITKCFKWKSWRKLFQDNQHFKIEFHSFSWLFGETQKIPDFPGESEPCWLCFCSSDSCNCLSTLVIVMSQSISDGSMSHVTVHTSCARVFLMYAPLIHRLIPDIF